MNSYDCIIVGGGVRCVQYVSTGVSRYRYYLFYHASAGANPMGKVNGWSGRNVAKIILKLINSFER